jgi:pimeloyl-ACP methyl ester carboxylesterase
MPDRVRSGYLATDRGSFAMLEAQPSHGVCERRPAILVPGYTGSKEDFLPVLEPLAAAGRTVVAIDQRGQYQSPHAPDRGGYAADELAADLLAIAAAIDHDAGGVHLVGHSMGGLVARQAVLRQSAGIRSLTLIGSGPASIAGQRAVLLRELLTLLDPDEGRGGDDRNKLRRQISSLWQEQLGPQALAEGTSQHILAFLRERMLRTCPIGLITMARYLLDCEDRTEELAALARLPIIVVYGENDDAWRPSVQDRMARRLGAERVCIPGAAHSPAVEAPDMTASTLTTFWNAAERHRPWARDRRGSSQEPPRPARTSS